MYIDKDALVAEIESSIRSLEKCLRGEFPMAASVFLTEQCKGRLDAYKNVLSLINALEVKVEREFSLEDYMSFFEKHPNLSDSWGFDEAYIFAKYFFELGQKGE